MELRALAKSVEKIGTGKLAQANHLADIKIRACDDRYALRENLAEGR